jgi:hypothetical protein
LKVSVLFITPPFTQLNTPYPATAYLKGFLNTKNISSYQCDLGIEVLLQLFSSKGLTEMFASIHPNESYSDNVQQILTLKEEYIHCIDDVIRFLQGKNPTIAALIASRNFLPEAGRFQNTTDLQWAFGAMGIQDKAKHIATLFLEDLSDLICACVDEHFGFSRYAERLGRCANQFDELHIELQKSFSFIEGILIRLLHEKITLTNPDLVALSVPFPGNLFSAFRCAQWIRQNHPHIKIAMGGGFPNTELRSLKEPRVFDYFDFITLDDGEAPIEQILKYINKEIEQNELKRTWLMHEDQVSYIDQGLCKDYKQADTGTPDYSDLLLDQYISAIEVANPMHSLWSDGRWNKLTMAHGCYWGKCTFCDISLDYIRLYEPITARLLCDRMETIIRQTGTNGFHFVDEAAPPALMRELALEILRRKLIVSWWTNIRFEKSFTRDLCLLLKVSGCIAVSGGLEVASDRLLELIQKGVTVAQVARVTRNFTESGIMVHAYLMYGFPTQTVQETVDSLEMVRQFFKLGILQSAFWHRFAMTAHSPIGMNPEQFNVQKLQDSKIQFAENDIDFIDPSGVNHEQFSFGLKKSLFNYMQGIGLDEPLQNWFENKIPQTTINSNAIETIILEPEWSPKKAHAKIYFSGYVRSKEVIQKSKKGRKWEELLITILHKTNQLQIQVAKEKGEWLCALLQDLGTNKWNGMTLKAIETSYEQNGWDDFELFWDNKPVNTLYKAGLLTL